MDDIGAELMNELFEAVGVHVREGGASASIVVVGGSSLSVHGWVERTTKDVDVIAQARREGGQRTLIPADPLPAALLEAVARVARDYGLPSDWLNTEVGAQWRFGFPPGFAAELEWREYGGLEVGFAGRSSLIALKLFATVDAGVGSVHFQDLVALEPTDEELEGAAGWVAGQDAGPEFPEIVQEAVSRVRRGLGRGGDAR